MIKPVQKIADFATKAGVAASRLPALAKKLPAVSKDKLVSFRKRMMEVLTAAKNVVFHNKYITVLGGKCREAACFLDDNRKIWYPVILIVYTIVIVAVTLSVDHTHVISKLNASKERELIEQMADSAAQSTLVRLEKGIPYSVTDKFTVEYKECKFDKTISPSNAKEFGAYYENHSDANLYMDVMLTYTNTSSQEIRADEAAKLTANCAGVNYICFAAVETEQGTNFEFAADSQVSAGESVVIHYIFDVPSTMKATSHDIVVAVVMDNKSYYIDIE